MKLYMPYGYPFSIWLTKAADPIQPFRRDANLLSKLRTFISMLEISLGLSPQSPSSPYAEYTQHQGVALFWLL